MVPVPSPGYDALLVEVKRVAAGIPNVEILAPRPRAEVLRLTERAVAVVSTSAYEGMPNVFLEAWSFGVPALALSHDPDGIIGEHRLGAFANGSLDALAQTAAELWENPRDAVLAKRCRSYVERRHSAEAVARLWQGLIEGARTDAGSVHLAELVKS
jgi:glycosyltransferase involved in cell wall biosynthesis